MTKFVSQFLAKLYPKGNYTSMTYQFESKVAKWPVDYQFHYLPVPPEVASHFSEESRPRVICTLNDQLALHAALQKTGEGIFYIHLGLATLKKLELEAGDAITASLEKDHSEFGMVMPEELAELLAIDEEAKTAFDSLTPGKKRSVIHMVSSAKRIETRINRAIKITDNLKMGIRDPRHFMKR